jgi:hypothetical protein
MDKVSSAIFDLIEKGLGKHHGLIDTAHYKVTRIPSVVKFPSFIDETFREFNLRGGKPQLVPTPTKKRSKLEIVFAEEAKPNRFLLGQGGRSAAFRTCCLRCGAPPKVAHSQRPVPYGTVPLHSFT